uniref:Uncharacterized protein n=1 Tax=Trypanosoma congolense (strain IL3000) TaxID=1068625 RepID=G0URN0_TRYCI|nr:hypothetical protein, unlikely [Trypanosoma congolense IL3000]
MWWGIKTRAGRIIEVHLPYATVCAHASFWNFLRLFLNTFIYLLGVCAGLYTFDVLFLFLLPHACCWFSACDTLSLPCSSLAASSQCLTVPRTQKKTATATAKGKGKAAVG